MGGRNQECALAAARHIAGSERIVMGSIDTDGTDGPGKQFVDGYDDVSVLNGGIVDGTTVPRAEELGFDVFGEMAEKPPLGAVFNSYPIPVAAGAFAFVQRGAARQHINSQRSCN